MGFADSPSMRDTLAGYGVQVSGYVWRWAPGLKGGTFPPHYDTNGEFAETSDSYDAYPGEDVNGDGCACNVVPVYRTSDGRFARPDNLVPIFQPPVTASQAVEVWRQPSAPVIDFGPLAELLGTPQPVTVNLVVPDSAIVVNFPDFQFPKIPTPQVTVQAPTVNVAPPTVNVAAPNVDVTTPETIVNVDVKPAPVKIIRDRVGKSVRFFRGSDGKIDKAEVTE